MNALLLQTEVQDFIRNYQGDLASLAFKGSHFTGVSVQELLQQVEGHRKTKEKLPSYHLTTAIYFPPKLNLEQTSSEVTAKYKASLVHGKTLVDITGGLGVDCLYFSERFDIVHHIEQDSSLSKLAAYNFVQLGKENIYCASADGMSAIKDHYYDVIYVDPARRHDVKGKVFFLRDCFPNVITHLDELLSRCKTLFIKTSPMLDISAGLNELTHVVAVHIVAVDNEVKELLWILQKEHTEKGICIHSVNISKGKQDTFKYVLDEVSVTNFGQPKKYLYEPNAAIMKSGGYRQISKDLQLEKLHLHSHLFTSNEVIAFPGRSFTIEKIIPYQKKEIKAHLQIESANITTRNFPESVSQLRKKWKIKEGGDHYLFFTTQLPHEKIVLVCRKL